MKKQIAPAPVMNTYQGFLRGDQEDRDMDKEDARLEEERKNAKVPERREPPPFLP